MHVMSHVDHQWIHHVNVIIIYSSFTYGYAFSCVVSNITIMHMESKYIVVLRYVCVNIRVHTTHTHACTHAHTLLIRASIAPGKVHTAARNFVVFFSGNTLSAPLLADVVSTSPDWPRWEDAHKNRYSFPLGFCFVFSFALFFTVCV